MNWSIQQWNFFSFFFILRFDFIYLRTRYKYFQVNIILALELLYMTIPLTTAFSSIIRIKTMLIFSDSTIYSLCRMEKENGKGIKEFLAHTCTFSPTKICIIEDVISHFKCLSSRFQVVKIKLSCCKRLQGNDN